MREINSGCICVGQEPSVSTFGIVRIILIVMPNKGIVNGGIKGEVSVVDELFNVLREGCVKNSRVLPIEGEHILH
jgi:hypothetical protein